MHWIFSSFTSCCLAKPTILRLYLLSSSDQIINNGPNFADGISKLKDDIYSEGLEDWPTIRKHENIVCLNCFQSTHITEECEYVLAMVILESLIKQVENCRTKHEENIIPITEENNDTISAGELNMMTWMRPTMSSSYKNSTVTWKILRRTLRTHLARKNWLSLYSF